MKKPVLLDGAVGTSLWEMAEANGVEKVPVWRYNLEHPEFVRALCERYVDAGADLILLQTFIDLHLMEIATRVAVRYGLPVFCAMTFEKVGKTMFGNSVQDVIDALTPLGIDAIGMNCSLGPDLALPVIREFAEKTDLPLLFKPNAGKPILAPDGSTVTDYDAETFVREVEPALDFVDYVGGCCGTNPEYIRLLGQRIARKG